MMTYKRSAGRTIGWNVDTQYDFMRPDGKLPVPGAEAIEKDLSRLTRILAESGVQVVNTADWHTTASREFSDAPDFKTTFPPHCLAESAGAAYVPATRPDPAETYAIDWRDADVDEGRLRATRNIVLYKDAFDIFAGSPHAERVLDILDPERVVVYGVASDVCVDFAVHGLLDRGREVYVVEDTIKELPTRPLEEVVSAWTRKGARMITVGDVPQYLSRRIKN